jgi:ATP-dependent DNA helicase RecG
MTEEEFELMLKEGEGYRIEFKEALSHLDREIVAFANSSGGKILLGVDDIGIIKRIKITNSLKSQIQDIANNCDPPIDILIRERQNVLIIGVLEGKDKLYKCSSGFYIRTGSNSQKLSRNEILQFVKAEGKVRFDEMIVRNFFYDLILMMRNWIIFFRWLASRKFIIQISY